jgi:hypothetical protein
MSLYRWQGRLLRRAAFGNMLARAKKCCCTVCCDLPNTLIGTLTSKTGDATALADSYTFTQTTGPTAPTAWSAPSYADPCNELTAAMLLTCGDVLDVPMDSGIWRLSRRAQRP